MFVTDNKHMVGPLTMGMSSHDVIKLLDSERYRDREVAPALRRGRERFVAPCGFTDASTRGL